LVAAGVRAVHYAVADPTAARGGAAHLRENGVDVSLGPLTEQATDFLEPWLFSVTHQRPFVTYKVASTLDGFVAAEDASSRWITGETARTWAHTELRATADAIAVGSATYTTDNPQLTVRGTDVVRQPRRIVLGNVSAEGFWVIPEHDPYAALAQMYDAGIRHLLLEGGPTVGAAFVRAGAVDDLVWIAAPALLGSGTTALAGLGISSVDQALRWRVRHTERLGEDVMIRCRRR
jgi:diaminohydroxyphosphoribosylaminopyrimidine deaminase/5-amino-6-(5-phosphoribosylamino)uracil reductase